MSTRYYNPEVGRFLNADALASTGQGILGNNMFAYCQNNPVIYIDPDGLCREVGALLTWIDCGNPSCPTSSLRQPTRYYSGDNRPKHKGYVTLHRHHSIQDKVNNDIIIQQNQFVIDGIGAYLDAVTSHISLQSEFSINKHMRVRRSLEYAADHPKEAVDFSLTIIGACSWYLSGLEVFGLIKLPAVAAKALWTVDTGTAICGALNGPDDFWKPFIGSDGG